MIGMLLVASVVLIFALSGKGKKSEYVTSPTDIVAGSEETAETDVVRIEAKNASSSAFAERHTVTFSVYGAPELICNTPEIAAGDLMDALGIDRGDGTRLSVDPSSKITGDIEIDVQSVTEVLDYQTEQIPYTTEYEDDSGLYEGEEEVETYGTEGVKTYTYKCTLVDGVEESRELISAEVTSEPVNEVIRRGTAVREKPAPVINGNTDDGTPQTEYLGVPTEYLYYVDVRATCYYIVGTTATGLPTGHNVMAVDPNVIPLGSKCIVIGELGDYGVRIAADVGGGIKGNIIDLWVPEGTGFGWQNARVYVLSEG